MQDKEVFFLFQLAEQFHMPVEEMYQRVSGFEIRLWNKYYKRKAELAKGNLDHGN